MMKALKQILDDRGISQTKVAEITKVSPPTVSRYLNSETDPPIGFVAALAEYLNVSVDGLLGSTAGAQAEKENQMIEQLKATYEKRIEDKRDHIASLKNRIEKTDEHYQAEIERLKAAHEKEIERLKAAHEKEIERLENRLADHKSESESRRKRMDHKNWIILGQFAAMLLITMFALYWVVDSLNGDWGFVQYERLLELLPESYGGMSYDVEPAEDFVGLWLK